MQGEGGEQDLFLLLLHLQPFLVLRVRHVLLLLLLHHVHLGARRRRGEEKGKKEEHG